MKKTINVKLRVSPNCLILDYEQNQYNECDRFLDFTIPIFQDSFSKCHFFFLKRKIQYIFLMIMAFNDFIITTSNSYINKCVWLFVVRVSRNRNHLSKISHWCQRNWCEVFFLQKKKVEMILSSINSLLASWILLYLVDELGFDVCLDYYYTLQKSTFF